MDNMVPKVQKALLQQTMTVALLVVGTGSIILSGCAERERKNPFDPEASQESPVSLSLKPTPSAVILEWTVAPISQVVGYRIYRSVNDERHFVLYQELNTDNRVFLDTDVERFRWYYYRVTALGPATESLPSNTERTYLGPGTIYLVSNSGFWIRQLSYDLLHELDSYDTRFPPVEWAPAIEDHMIWLAYGPYQHLGRLNLVLGREDNFFEEDLRNPVDVEIDDRTRRLFVLDDGNNELIVIDDLKVIHRVQLPKGVYLRCQIHSGTRRLGILSETRFLLFSLDSRAIVHQRNADSNFRYQDLEVTDKAVYLLASDVQEQQTQLITLTPPLWEAAKRPLNGIFFEMAVDVSNQVFYLAQITDIRRPDENQRLVKLSFSGSRLLEVDNFNFIADIKINPYDHSVVVVDRLRDRLSLINEEGKLISESIKLYDPIRVHIE